DCDAAYEAIVDLRHPSFGSYFVWDKVYGTQDDIERLVTGTLAPNGNAVAIGEKQSGSGGLVSLFMAEFDRRGRPVWEESYSVKNIREAVKMLAREKEYMVLANQKDGEKRSRI